MMMAVFSKVRAFFNIVYGWISRNLEKISYNSGNIVPKSVADRLLQSSYFPTQRPNIDEMPPVFSSKSFTYPVAVDLAKLLHKKSNGFDAVEYRLTKADGQVRPTHIPYPIAYANLVLNTEKDLVKFNYIFENKSSFIRPRMHKDGRVIVMKYESWLKKTLMPLQWKTNSKFLVQADISNFFPSIYTHSIPWALAGIQEAKKSKNKAWYDELDRSFRLTKRNETNGVLIGPATSNIAAEIVLYKVDKRLSNNGYKFFRHIDDYQCYCETLDEAERFLSDLTTFLSYYKLSLNSKKTIISNLPQPSAEPWILDIRREARALGKILKSGQVSSFLDYVTQIYLNSKEKSVFRYAVSILQSKSLNNNAKVTAFIQILGLSQYAPNIVPNLNNFFPTIQDCYKHDIASYVLNALRQSLSFNRSDISSWLIYFLYKMQKELPTDLIDNIIKKSDCILILLIFACSGTYGKTEAKKFAKRALSSSDEFDSDSHWLLIYELYRVGALKNVKKHKQCFETMKNHGVKFCSIL